MKLKNNEMFDAKKQGYITKDNLNDDKMKKTNVSKLKEVLAKASNTELYFILEEVKKEIRLSETAIKEGFEKK